MRIGGTLLRRASWRACPRHANRRRPPAARALLRSLASHRRISPIGIVLAIEAVSGAGLGVEPRCLVRALDQPPPRPRIALPVAPERRSPASWTFALFVASAVQPADRRPRGDLALPPVRHRPDHRARGRLRRADGDPRRPLRGLGPALQRALRRAHRRPVGGRARPDNARPRHHVHPDQGVPGAARREAVPGCSSTQTAMRSAIEPGGCGRRHAGRSRRISTPGSKRSPGASPGRCSATTARRPGGR